MIFDIPAVIGIVAGSSTLSTFLTAWFIRSKVRAEARKADAEAEVTSGTAWKELLQPYRDSIASLRAEMKEMRAELRLLGCENTELRTELRAAKQQIGILSRAERESMVESAAVKTALAGAGIEVPVASPPLARTRSDDREV